MITALKQWIKTMFARQRSDQQKTEPLDRPIFDVVLEALGTFGLNPYATFAHPVDLFFQFYETNPWVFMAVDAIVREVARDAFRVRIIAARPTPEQERRRAQLEDWCFQNGMHQLRMQTALDLVLAGNAFWELTQPPLAGRVFRLPPQTIFPIGTTRTGIEAWVQVIGSVQRIIPKDRVIHFKVHNPRSDVFGLPRLAPLVATIETDNAMQQFNRAYFKNGASAGLVLVMDTEGMTETDAMRRWQEMLKYIERRYHGPEASHAPLLLAGRWRVHGEGQARADVQFIEGRRLNRDEIFGVLGVPPAILGFGEYGRLGASLDDVAYEQFRSTVESYEEIIDQTIYRQLIQQHLKWTDIDTVPARTARRRTVNAAIAAQRLSTIPDTFTKDEIRSVAGFDSLGEGGQELVSALYRFPEDRDDLWASIEHRHWQRSDDEDAHTNRDAVGSVFTTQTPANDHRRENLRARGGRS